MTSGGARVPGSSQAGNTRRHDLSGGFIRRAPGEIAASPARTPHSAIRFLFRVVASLFTRARKHESIRASRD